MKPSFTVALAAALMLAGTLIVALTVPVLAGGGGLGACLRSATGTCTAETCSLMERARVCTGQPQSQASGAGSQAADQTRTQTRDQTRTQTTDQTCTQTMEQTRAQTRDQTRDQSRLQTRDPSSGCVPQPQGDSSGNQSGGPGSQCPRQ
ncbi:MAG: hypothetical protein KKF41_09655 [Actinobacteria bacterium]|nr:hypothetical protein [Actinomycetota bacterium]MBU1945266.1 hypothetical protein [Actinomycetota bacterium]MBU2687838.1 hypothetical protein [Actinomycetota bacterium]